MIIKVWELREITPRFIEVWQTTYFFPWTFIQEFYYYTPVFLVGETKPLQDFFAGAKSNPILLRV